MNSVINTPIGPIKITANESAITSIEFNSTDPIKHIHHPIIDQAIAEIHAYLKNPAAIFTVPYQLKVTAFQQSVLNALQQIPIGQTRTYGQLAAILNTSARAVGNACRHNPLPLIFPCHRIVAKSGIGGFSGQTEGQMINSKQWLLQHESSQ